VRRSQSWEGGLPLRRQPDTKKSDCEKLGYLTGGGGTVGGSERKEGWKGNIWGLGMSHANKEEGVGKQGCGVVAWVGVKMSKFEYSIWKCHILWKGERG